MSKQYTRKEIAELGNPKKVLFIIDNVVYDVNEFLDEHPGGHEVLTNVAGKDASEDFDDIGHSLDAKELMKKYVVGELVPQDRVEPRTRDPGRLPIIARCSTGPPDEFDIENQFPRVTARDALPSTKSLTDKIMDNVAVHTNIA
ncbi:cytochrome b5-like heme/Steroid binding domain-containing protein [Phthorimaea operculella]|nr:cytochrome b5-like heme/Steroid binding domain-containing protein [Phthorimaea operculella]